MPVNLPVNGGDDEMREHGRPDHDPGRRNLLRQSLALAGIAAFTPRPESIAPMPRVGACRIRIPRTGER